jgi:hypothetical protein
MTVEELKTGIQSGEAEVRTSAWRSAGEVGAPAIAVLIPLTQAADAEVARAAMRGLWAVVRHAGRPGAEEERAAVTQVLLPILAAEHPATLRRDVAWMLSEIATDADVAAMKGYLGDPVLMEDMRCVIERIPGEASVAALQEALESADDAFKPSLAQGLRARDVEVDGIPCVKLVPTRSTAVEVAE